MVVRPSNFRSFVRFLANHPGIITLSFLLLTAVCASYAIRLRIDSDFSKLIPSSYASVQALETLRSNLGGESEAAVVIESPSFGANTRFAEAIIPRVLELRGKSRPEAFFTRVDYKKDIRFLKENALYFATDAELDSLEAFLDARIEQARLEANPFYFELEEDESIQDTDSAIADLRASYDRLVGKEYPISQDSTTLVLRFYPSGLQTDIKFIHDAYAALDDLMKEMNPAAFHPEMEITLAGRLLRQLIEVEAIVTDVQKSFGSGVLTVLLMVIFYFSYKSYQARAGRYFSWRILSQELIRTPVTGLVIGIPLMASITWTFAVAYFQYGNLNMMTSTLGLVLFGMGIDYGIHFYARYAEERGLGRSVTEGLEHTLQHTGKALIITALTTASAFYLLTIADFRGFSEFGFIAGTGILLALFAMIVLLPALLAFFEKVGLLDFCRKSEYSAITNVDALKPDKKYSTVRSRSRSIVVACAVLVGISITLLPSISFEYNFGKLDPVYAEYTALQNKVRKVYSDKGRRNPAYVIVDHPSDAPLVEAAIREHMRSDTLSPTVSTVETFQNRFPIDSEAALQKLARIEKIRERFKDPFLKASDSEDLELLRMAASTKKPIPLDQVPLFLTGAFTSKDGSIGRIVIIYPSVGLSDGKMSMAFSDDVGTIHLEDGRVFHAGSTPLVAADMLRLMRHESPYMVLYTVLLIIVFKLFILRSVRWTILAMLPLAVGFLWMFGLSALLGVKLNFYNLVVLPAILGIGDDSGIHIVHRYLEEGRGSIFRVLRSTGEHISMSALTTMVGFGGLIQSFYPGLQSIGQLAVLGIGMTLISALVFLPALLIWLEKRDDSVSEPEVEQINVAGPEPLQQLF